MNLRNNSKRLLCLLVFVLIIQFSGTALAEHCLDIEIDALLNSRNLLNNEGFEDDLTSWGSYNPDPGISRAVVNTDRGKSMEVTWDGRSDEQDYWHTYQSVPLVGDRSYRAVGVIKTNNLTCVNPGQENWNGARILFTSEPRETEWSASSDAIYGTENWSRVSAETEVPAVTDEGRIILRRLVGGNSGPSVGIAWWDDLQVIPVPEIDDVSIDVPGNKITISGNNFGSDPRVDDPEFGVTYGDENCLLHGGGCIDITSIISWNDDVIEIDNQREDAINVRSGGVVSNAMVEDADFTLFNNTISINFPDIINGYGIGQIKDGSDNEFINVPAEPASIMPLYEFTVKNDPFTDNKTTIRSTEASYISRTYSEESGIKKLTVTAYHCNEFTVTAEIKLPSDAGGAQFTIRINICYTCKIGIDSLIFLLE